VVVFFEKDIVLEVNRKVTYALLVVEIFVEILYIHQSVGTINANLVA
jgi:hypothetical protein